MRVRARLATTALLVLLLIPTASIAGAGAGTEAKHIPTAAEVAAFQAAHPDDYVGFDKLVYAATGRHIQVAMPGVPYAMGAAEAQRRWDNRGALQPLGGIPNFSLSITASPFIGPVSGPRPTVLTGKWDFPDSWAGQASPFDEASISWNGPDCVQMSNYEAFTYTYNGTSTNLGSLRTSGLNTHAPIWNIADKTSGFASQADHGQVQLRIKNACGASKSIGADFQYEANQGSSLLSVSAGWGILSVSYSGSNLSKQLGTEPVYFTLPS